MTLEKGLPMYQKFTHRAYIYLHTGLYFIIYNQECYYTFLFKDEKLNGESFSSLLR